MTRKKQQRGNVIALDSRRSTRALMHREQIVSTQLFSFPPGGRDHLGPSGGRDAPPLLPLGDGPVTLVHGVGHLGDGVPQLKEVGNCAHAPDSVGDGLSRQVGTMNSVTGFASKRTMCPRMGRGTTPANVKKSIAERLRAARIAAEYPTQAEFAKQLGVEVERYKKWESGRTPIPHEFVAMACELLGKDANYLYGIQAKVAMRKAV